MSQQLLALRDYQRETIDAVTAAHGSGMQRPAVVLPTGAGKTVIFTHMATEHLAAQNGRVLILVHRDELADQTVNKFRQIAPHLNVGKVKAADNHVDADVIVASVQTVSRQARMEQVLAGTRVYGHIGLVIVDECHHATAVTYRNVMAALGCYSGEQARVPGEYDTRAAGFTATLARGDGTGLGDVWQDVVYTKSVLWMVARGYLVDPRARLIDIAELDLSAVKRSGGDYSAKSLGDALMEAGGPDIVAQIIGKHAADRRPMVFTPTVEMAGAVARTLSAAGFPADYVSGATPREERLLIYKRFRTGELHTLVNCMVLTEGADFPFADCAVIARPTRSDTLFIQMVGRVLRPSPATGKQDALVLLLAGEGGKIRTLIDLDSAVPDVQDGESLAEAYEREEARKEAKAPAGSVRFELKHKDLDLFGGSTAYQWLRTWQGVQFIPTGGAGEIILWPSAEPEQWDVVHVPEERKTPWQRLHTGLALGMAMAWAESEADERSSLNTSRSATWRRKRVSEKALNYAWRLGCPEAESDMKAGEVGDMISVALASRKIDRFVKRA